MLGPNIWSCGQVPIPVPQAGELLVKVRAALTCGTDVKTYRRGHPKFPPPFAFGHEFGGDVVGVGKEVQEFRPGDPVTANVFAECGGVFLLPQRSGQPVRELGLQLWGLFRIYDHSKIHCSAHNL